LQAQGLPVFFWPSGRDEAYIQQAISHLGPTVYVSIDLDVFDPSLMPAVGTPEPGGAGWYEVMSLLKALGESRRIVGFDVSELAPDEGPKACAYTAAKLIYKLIAYSVPLPAEGSEQSKQ
jgi:agmatinase